MKAPVVTRTRQLTYRYQAPTPEFLKSPKRRARPKVPPSPAGDAPPVALSIIDLERAAEAARRIALGSPTASDQGAALVHDVEHRALEILLWMTRRAEAKKDFDPTLGPAIVDFLARVRGKEPWPSPPAPVLSRRAV